MRKAHATRTAILILVAAAVPLNSCKDKERPAAVQAPIKDERAAIEAYGYGPDPNGSAVYQPDVVLIKGGPQAVRAVSEDGQTWVIDGKAGGASELTVGKIMFATSRGVGRVGALQKRGDDLAVTLEPARLTEIVRDADIKFERALKPDDMVFQALPSILNSGQIERPALSEGDPNRGVVTLAAQSVEHTQDGILISMTPLIFTQAGPAAVGGGVKGPDPNPKTKFSGTVTVRDFDITASYKEEARGTEVLGLSVARKLAFMQKGQASVGLKFGADVKLVTKNMFVRTGLPIHDGAVSEGATFIVDGLEEFEVGIWGGAEKGVLDNTNVKVEVPMEILFEIPPGPETAGIPIVLQIKSKFIVTTAFGSNNATLKASGRYGLHGPLGLQGGSVVAPTVSVKEPMMKSLEGMTLSANGIVFAIEHRILGGVGTKLALAGPYAKMTISVGLTVGSSLGIIQCKGGTLKIDVAAGVGVQGSKELEGVWEKIFGKKVSTSFDLGEVTVNALKAYATIPDVPLCRG